MTISSIIVKVNPDHLREVVSLLSVSELCEYHLDDGKSNIIVTIEGSGTEEELKILRKIQAIDKVLSAEMVYSYSEDEIDELKDALENSSGPPDWLNDDNADVSKIKYGGNPGKEI